ncbi:hypothetical protein [Usitatibacter palustris]|uniref:Ferric reductase like transmembrane component n=1 Tax=Usitatibacter palustris TaxID=2732487 RepID=A0A6M4H5X1_9PROT|nr:hypothetical protein [Usitatibacter palustris]QJR15016.1 hypothetical protein DSM104440_01832 [Usitatibacter palustris]
MGLCVLSGLAYLWHEPPTKPYGGTWLGYTLGTIGALLILWLLWYGVRKRRYRSNTGTVQGWLSAHVYLGVALVVVVTLHTGFELGWNVHTLAYVLMVAVVVSGLYGVFIYLRAPNLMTANLGAETLDSILLKIADLDRAMREAALSLPDDLFAQVEKSVRGTSIGGSFVRIFSGRDPDCPTARAVRDMPVIAKRLTGEQALVNKQVYTMLVEKNELLFRARRDLRLKSILDLWLFIHVPLAVALLAALAAHVLSVFIYW